MNSKEPEWFKSFRINLDQRLNNIESDIKELKSDMKTVKSDIKLMKATPTMARELGLK